MDRQPERQTDWQTDRQPDRHKIDKIKIIIKFQISFHKIDYNFIFNDEF